MVSLVFGYIDILKITVDLPIFRARLAFQMVRSAQKYSWQQLAMKKNCYSPFAKAEDHVIRSGQAKWPLMTET